MKTLYDIKFLGICQTSVHFDKHHGSYTKLLYLKSGLYDTLETDINDSTTELVATATYYNHVLKGFILLSHNYDNIIFI